MSDSEDSNGAVKKVNYRDKFRNIIQNISSVIIPLIMLANIDSKKLVIAILPSLIAILFLMYDYYEEHYKKNKLEGFDDAHVVMVKDKKELEDYNSNQLYKDIEYYINDAIMKKGMKTSLVDENITLKHIRNDYYDYIYNLSLPEKEYINFTFNGEKITIFKDILESSNNGANHVRALRIVSSKFETVSNFLKHCQQKYRAYIDGLEKVTYHFYRYNNESKKWISKKLHTVKNYNNIILPLKLEQDVTKWISEFKDSKSRYQERGIPYKLGLLFHGVPGCGKTSLTYAIAYETNRNIYQVPLSTTINCEELKSIIDTIPEGNIILFEEIDTCAFFNKREHVDEKKVTAMYSKMKKTKKKTSDSDSETSDEGSSNESDESDSETSNKSDESDTEEKSKKDKKKEKNSKLKMKGKNFFNKKKIGKMINGENKLDMNMSKDTDVFSTYVKTQMAHILEILDGYNYLHDTITIMYTNHLDKIDSAIVRPGRVDHKIMLTYADYYQIKKLYRLYYDEEIDDKYAKIIEKRRVTTSFLINTCIVPCFKDMNESINLAINEPTY